MHTAGTTRILFYITVFEFITVFHSKRMDKARKAGLKCYTHTVLKKKGRNRHDFFLNKTSLHYKQMKDRKYASSSDWPEPSPSPTSVSRLIGRWDLQICRLHPPDFTCILGNGAVAGELSRVGDVSDHLFGPFFKVLKMET